MKLRSVLFFLGVILILFIGFRALRTSPPPPSQADESVIFDQNETTDYSNIVSENGTIRFFISAEDDALFSSQYSSSQAVSDLIRKDPEVVDSNVRGVSTVGLEPPARVFPPEFAQSIQAARNFTDSQGRQHFFYNQTINGTPIFGAAFAAHVRDGKVIYAMSGNLLADQQAERPVLSTSDVVSQAIQIADARAEPHGKLAAALYEDVYFNARLLGGTDTRTYPAVTVIVAEQTEPVMFARKYIVSKVDGAVLYEESLASEALNRIIYDCAGGAIDCPGVRAEGYPSSGIADADAAFDIFGTIHNYYKSTFGRDSYDGLGSVLKAFVRITTQMPCPNAVWLKAPYNQMAFCNGMVTPDIMAHEFTHGVIHATVDLISSNQSGALDEGIADIFAFAIDTDDWTVGEGSALGIVRNAADPTTDPRGPHPDRLFSPYYVCSTVDNGGIHSNMTIISKAFYLMTQGGTFNGCSLNGIGRTKAHAIWYRALTTYLTPSSNFADAYSAVLQACTDLYGSTSSDCTQTKSALQAVELDQQPAGEALGPNCLGYAAQPARCAGSVPTSTSTPSPSATPTGPTPTLQPTVTVTQGACPRKTSGDSNCDGSVTLVDFEIWRKEYLRILSSNQADFNSSGTVDLADFQIWRSGYFTI